MSKIIITVAGQAAGGKSLVAEIISEALINAGLSDVTVNDEDVSPELRAASRQARHLAVMNKQPEIVIQQVQLPRKEWK